MRFTIQRSKWLRGETFYCSRLLRPEDGKQCCMGQVASQCGVPECALRDISSIKNISRELRPAVAAFMLDGHIDGKELPWVLEAYEINDDDTITDAERESKLAALAAANGHEFVFVD